MRCIRRHLTFANVVSVIALFVALGGTAMAGVIITRNSQVDRGTISGHKPPRGKHPNIMRGSVNGTDLANNLVGGAKINESTLGKVPLAAGADSLNGKSAAELEGARAYAVVRASFCAAPVSFCSVQHTKRVAYAAHVATGVFCVGVNGISATSPKSFAVVTPTVGGGDTWAHWRAASSSNINCDGSEFEVITGTGAASFNDRDFSIVIP
jgi:hypothetical protein